VSSDTPDTRTYQTGDDVRALRDELGLKQGDLGALLYDGYSRKTAQKTISELERGTKSTSGAVRRSLQRIEALHREDLPLY
jgi:DNA-binding transcriptional regulator YiaG